MTEVDTVDLAEGESTGLPWPKSWKGTYLFVLCCFALWLILLIALTECGA
jgi:hypothetical protein